MNELQETPESIIGFWFGDEEDDAAVAKAQSALWWAKSEATDEIIRSRFGAIVEVAGSGELDHWADESHGLLALILLTDQFTRNILRGASESFDYDAKARQWCKSGLGVGVDRELRHIQRVFFYLPMEHSEDIEDQERSVELFRTLADEAPSEHRALFGGYVDFAIRHRDIVGRFGRFPHRNKILGRESTPEEIAFLEEPGSSF